MFNLLTQNAGATGANQYSFLIIMVVMFAAMYFFTIRPQKKRQKEEQEMRNAVDVGDEITTIGGICGKVVTVKEDKLIIETGIDRTKMTITRWAVQQNNTASERLAAEREAAKAAAEAERAAAQAAAATPVPTAEPTPAAPEGIICPSCGAVNSGNTKFCGECGTKLEIPQAPVPKICSGCGAEIAPGLKFCGECGTRVE